MTPDERREAALEFTREHMVKLLMDELSRGTPASRASAIRLLMQLGESAFDAFPSL